MPKLPHKTHPQLIYTEPENGMIYFVEGNSVGSDFGFPRVDMKKRYRWKKMNFTTDLPKKRPYVTYIVASAVKCEKFFPDSKNEGPSFRMHAVIINKEGMQTQKYKSKNTQTPTIEDPYSSVSTKCSSVADIGEPEKFELVTDETGELKKTPKKDEKSYILCHIRKIDHAYKVPKSSGKRRGSYEDEEEEEVDDEELESTLSSKKLVIEQKITPLIKTEEPSPLKDLTSSSSFKLNKSAENKVKSFEGIHHQGSAFQATNHSKTIGFTLREKKSDSDDNNHKKIDLPRTLKNEPNILLKKDSTLNQIKLKQDSTIKIELNENKELLKMKEAYKERTENYDYYKLFNVLVNSNQNK